MLARELSAKILTTDFNLNKIASLQGVTVLNINDLAKARKPVLLPGEGMNLYVVKEGKERGQGIGYLDDIDQALAVLMDLLERDPRVHGDPAPQVMVTDLAESAVNLNLRCWTAAEDYWSLRFDLAKGVKQRLDQAGISIPYPQREVHLHRVKET